MWFEMFHAFLGGASARLRKVGHVSFFSYSALIKIATIAAGAINRIIQVQVR